MDKTICIFSASSNSISVKYFEAASRLGAEIARRGDRLIFGGAEVGLMGAAASAAHKGGAEIIGVIPQRLLQHGIAHEDVDELIITKDLRERKAVMDARADVFMILPGGFGTLEETLEIITLKQLKYHHRPIIFLNIEHFFEPLRALFEFVIQENFAKDAYRQLYYFAPDVPSAFAYLDNYEPPELEDKWG